MDYTNKTIGSTYKSILHIESGSVLVNGTGSRVDSLDITASFALNGGGTEIITGSTYPITSSWSENSISSSYAPQVIVDTVPSSSWASSSISASYSNNASSASYVPNLYPQTQQVSASWASSSISASYVPNLYPQTQQVSASWASSSLNAISSSYLSGSTAYLSINNFSSSVQDALLLVNTASASASLQQYSPAIRLTGQGWSTTNTSSRATEWRIYAQPAQASSNPTNVLVFDSAVAGGAFSNYMTISPSTGLTTFSGNIRCLNVALIGWTGRCLMASPADGQITLTNNATTDFTRLNFGTNTSGSPALAKSGNSLAVQLADGSAATAISASQYLAYITSSITTSTPALDIQQTWSGSTTSSVFTAIKANITDTQSSGSSLLLDLQVNNTSSFSVNKTGSITISTPNATSLIPGLVSKVQAGGTSSPAGVYFLTTSTSNSLILMANGVQKLFLTTIAAPTSNIRMDNVCGFGWSNNASAPAGNMDAGFYRDAAGIVGMRVSSTSGNTAPHTLRIYNSGSVSTDYLRVAHTGNQIVWEKSGSLDFLITSSLPALDIQQTWSGSSNTFTAIKANITDTTSTTSSLLLDLQTNSTSSFNVNKYGGVSIISSSAAPTVGVATLSSGMVKVNTSAVKANSIIFINAQDGYTGSLCVNNKVANTSFDITGSLSATSNVAWQIINMI